MFRCICIVFRESYPCTLPRLPEDGAYTFKYVVRGLKKYKLMYMYICDWLWAGRSEDRILVGRDFLPVQTGPGAHPASWTMGTASFPGVKCGRGVQLTTHPLPVPWSWKSRAIPLPNLWATTGPVTGNTLPLYIYIYIYICCAHVGLDNKLDSVLH